MKIVFITRKYPPIVGGMERFSADFFVMFKDDAQLIALRKSQVHLVWWLPVAFLRALIAARKADVIHIGDGLLAGFGVMLKWFTRKPVSITIHGLDVTFKKFGYQSYIWWALQKLDAIVCVSEPTAKIVQAKGLATTVIHNAIDTTQWKIQRSKKIIQDRFPEYQGKKILLTVGRLIKRKGVVWFVDHVMPQLDDTYIYLVTSEGPEESRIKEAIRKHHLEARVKLLGLVDTITIKQLYGAADIFIMPNIELENDREGFGIVAIEAAATGLPVLAADIEGLRDAVVDGKTGFLVESGQEAAWKQAIYTHIEHPTLNSEQIREYIQNNFSWNISAQQYKEIFNHLLPTSHG